MPEKPKAVLLLSGGLDSATVAAIARTHGFDLYALSLRSGQRHEVELEYAQKIVAMTGIVQHKIVDIDLRAFGGSALTADIAVPKNRDEAEMTDIPVTYVPARNLLFLSYALGWAEVLGAQDLFIGVNAIDYSGYPDCRPEFVASFQITANLATKAGVSGKPFTVHAPLQNMTKAEIIRTGVALGLDYSNTHSCYDPAPDGRSCGGCDSCILRKKGFAEAGIPDPTRYI